MEEETGRALIAPTSTVYVKAITLVGEDDEPIVTISVGKCLGVGDSLTVDFSKGES